MFWNYFKKRFGRKVSVSLSHSSVTFIFIYFIYVLTSSKLSASIRKKLKLSKKLGIKIVGIKMGVMHMKLSTKGRYGLRAIVDLAMNSKEEAVALSSIAERQNISISYLEQLIAKLRKAGLVNSIRGAQGGYVLAKDPKEISIGDILRALEGNLNPVDCSEIEEGAETECSGKDLCVTKYVWKKISDSINQTVDNISLYELVQEGHAVKNKNQNNELTTGEKTERFC